MIPEEDELPLEDEKLLFDEEDLLSQLNAVRSKVSALKNKKDQPVKAETNNVLFHKTERRSSDNLFHDQQ